MKSRAIKGYKGILAGLAMVASLVVSVIFSGCDSISGGSYCDDKNGQQLYTKLLKDFLVKNDEDLKPYIDKIDFAYEIDNDLSNIDKEKKSASCIIKNVKLKFDTKDTMTLSGKLDEKVKQGMTNLSAVFGSFESAMQLKSMDFLPRFLYIVSYIKDDKKGDQIVVQAPTFSNSISSSIVFTWFFNDIPENIKNYYDGTGVLIDGKKKGACPNGVRQERDKNGEISFEGGCTNGTKEGAWKYYDNGFLAKEELYKNGDLKTRTIYEPTTGVIKSAFIKDDSGNAAYREYDKEGYITKFVPYSTNEQGKLVVNGKMLGEFRYKSDLEGLGITNAKVIELGTGMWDSNELNYAEVSNGNIVVGRYYDKTYLDKKSYLITEKFKTEQEEFDYLSNAKARYEIIDLGNLNLVAQYKSRNDLYYGFYKNEQEVGSVWKNYGDSARYSDLCTTGQCQVMFKELIDKSIYKNEIYSILESAKPTK